MVKSIKGFFRIINAAFNIQLNETVEVICVRSSHDEGDRSIARTQFVVSDCFASDLLEFLADIVGSVARAAKTDETTILNEVFAFVQERNRRRAAECAEN